MSHCTVQNILLVTKNERQPFLCSVPRSTYRWLAGQAWHAEYDKTDGKVVSRFITVRDHIGFGGLDKARWLWWYAPWSLKNGGDCSAQRRGGSIPRKGTVWAKVWEDWGTLQRQNAAQSGWERIAKGAIVHTASLPYSLQKQGGALTGNGGSPLRCQEDNLHESALGSGHGEESWKGHCGPGLKGQLRCTAWERSLPFWGHSWFWVIRELMGHLGGRASVGKSGAL